jgi:HEAT repeat protein
VLLAGLTNQQGRVREYIVECVSQMGGDAGPLVPVLVQCLKDEDERVAAKSAQMLGLPQFSNALVVPALTESLGDSRTRVRQYAAEALLNQARWRSWSNTAPATAALLKLLNDPEKSVRTAATEALWKIDPEELDKATH